MNTSLSKILVGFLIVLIAGCGFQLRGNANLSDQLSVMFIQGISTKSGLGLELKRTLENNGVTVLSQYDKSASVLTLVENEVDRRVLSVGSDAKATEYQLYQEVSFKVAGNKGELLSDVQTVKAQRDYRFNQNQVLGSENEQAFLTENLNKQLAQSIFRRLAAIK
jgi:LPS-assembly lipoprotein